ncbi:MAG: hypothetical protein ACP5Q0_07005 [Halothiobacillus sp.]
MEQPTPFIKRTITRALCAATLGLALSFGAHPATAESLMRPDINHAKPGDRYYVHGLSMHQITNKFGAPAKKLHAIPARGTKHQPPITRWIYPDFTVYFEHGRAIHLVKDHPRVK